MARGTTLRNVRVDENTWERAKWAAEMRGESVSDAVRAFLVRYAAATEKKEATK